MNRGSIWRIWDLHVHSPASYGGSYETFIQNVQNSKAHVIGINDYCTIKGYQEVLEKGGIRDKVIFPVVELRMHNLIETKKNPNGIKINFHIIFDNDPGILSKITIWLSSIECFDKKGTTIQLGTIKNIRPEEISFDFEKVIESLKKYELYGKHALVWLPYDEYGGIDEVDPIRDGLFKLSLINKSHIIGTSTRKQIDFFNWKNPKFEKSQYEEWFGHPKPCIKGSDAHKINYPFGKLKNHLSQPAERYCWICSEPTFSGLKHILVEPERVFIGEEPKLLTRIRANKTKFIKSIAIKRAHHSNINDIWFENFSIELNKGLVAIIGKKGSGKSATTDVIGLCGNSHQDISYFSFLTKDKFRKAKPVNLSNKFIGELVWENGEKVEKKLSENPELTLPERVKYIPQHFLEKICTEIDSQEFEQEIKDIIFSHTPIESRFEKSSLDELINYKSSLIVDEIEKNKNQLKRLNSEIIDLEKKSSKEYREIVVNKFTELGT